MRWWKAVDKQKKNADFAKANSDNEKPSILLSVHKKGAYTILRYDGVGKMISGPGEMRNCRTSGAVQIQWDFFLHKSHNQVTSELDRLLGVLDTEYRIETTLQLICSLKDYLSPEHIYHAYHDTKPVFQTADVLLTDETPVMDVAFFACEGHFTTLVKLKNQYCIGVSDGQLYLGVHGEQIPGDGFESKYYHLPNGFLQCSPQKLRQSLMDIANCVCRDASVGRYREARFQPEFLFPEDLDERAERLKSAVPKNVSKEVLLIRDIMHFVPENLRHQMSFQIGVFDGMSFLSWSDVPEQYIPLPKGFFRQPEREIEEQLLAIARTACPTKNGRLEFKRTAQMMNLDSERSDSARAQKIRNPIEFAEENRRQWRYLMESPRTGGAFRFYGGVVHGRMIIAWWGYWRGYLQMEDANGCNELTDWLFRRSLADMQRDLIDFAESILTDCASLAHNDLDLESMFSDDFAESVELFRKEIEKSCVITP